MAKFVINPKSSSQKDVPLNAKAVSIGRDPANDLVLSDSMVSRRHAMLELREDTYFLRDNNSSNGTFVNGDRLDEEVRLRDGDLVAIGSSKLLFHGTEDADVAGYVPDAGGALPTAGLDQGILPSTKPLTMESPSPGKTAGRCESCGSPSTRGDRFCRKCGKPLSPAASSEPASRTPPPVPPVPARRMPPRPQGSAASTDPEAVPTYIAPRPVAGRRPVAEPAGFGIRLVAYLVDSIILYHSLSAREPGSGRPVPQLFCGGVSPVWRRRDRDRGLRES